MRLSNAWLLGTGFSLVAVGVMALLVGANPNPIVSTNIFPSFDTLSFVLSLYVNVAFAFWPLGAIGAGIVLVLIRVWRGLG